MADDVERGRHVCPIAARVILNVRALRKQRGLSVRALADLLGPDVGLSRSSLANMESGRRQEVTLSELAAFARGFGYPDPWDLTQPFVPPLPPLPRRAARGLHLPALRRPGRREGSRR